MVEKELKQLLLTFRVDGKFPKVNHSIENEIWINCGLTEEESAKISSHIRIDKEFNNFLDRHNAACGLHRKLNYKGVMVWRLQVRY